jgi:quercetin 2,3-dioxygenase
MGQINSLCNMKRQTFLKQSLLTLPALALGAAAKAHLTESPDGAVPEAFVVKAGQSRFGEVNKYMGIHPNDVKISGKDTSGQLAMLDYTGLAKIEPPLHVHHKQDEIFTVIEGEYRFVVGTRTEVLRPGDTIFLPRGIPHTWLQLTDRGRLIYLLQPAGKMEAFFTAMQQLQGPPTQEILDRIHAEHDMAIVGPPLSL